jgi:hypothetical protein
MDNIIVSYFFISMKNTNYGFFIFIELFFNLSNWGFNIILIYLKKC